MAKNSLAGPAAAVFLFPQRTTSSGENPTATDSVSTKTVTSRKPKRGKAMKGYGKGIKQVNYTAGNRSSFHISYCSLGWF